MILSHEHKFIFLRTKKTAGTSIELALSDLCGPDDIITPLTGEDEARRAGRRGAQNWRLHSWWKSPRLLKRAWFKFSAKDYGFYNHMKAEEMRARPYRSSCLAELFQVCLRAQPLGPAGVALLPSLPRGK